MFLQIEVTLTLKTKLYRKIFMWKIIAVIAKQHLLSGEQDSLKYYPELLLTRHVPSQSQDKVSFIVFMCADNTQEVETTA